ncbi:MAG: PIN domain-containing protein [Luteolibacter sp.]|uniref:PIN domain-containing protein n=1 Tax=Luteolibacter sp. TaxID=1962973 RepID=UPI003267B642
MTALIDTSAWIEFLRPKGDSAIKSRVADLIGLGYAAYACPVRYELVLGARPSELDDLQQALDFSKRIVVTAAHWDTAAELGAALRLKGLNFPALDLIIAIVASAEKIPLLARDAHFFSIRDQVLPDLELG